LESTVLISNIINNMLIRLAADIKAPCQLVSLEGNYAHIKTTRTQFQPSIGYVHALVERLKRSGEYPIKEYSCSQATLEQIFDNFAQEIEFAPFNRQTIATQKTSLAFDSPREGGFEKSQNRPSGNVNESLRSAAADRSVDESPLLQGFVDEEQKEEK